VDAAAPAHEAHVDRQAPASAGRPNDGWARRARYLLGLSTMPSAAMRSV
jgi:hypothetical protein